MIEMWLVEKEVIPDPPAPKSSGQSEPKGIHPEVRLWIIKLLELHLGWAPFEVSILFESESEKVLAMPGAAALLESSDDNVN